MRINSIPSIQTGLNSTVRSDIKQVIGLHAETDHEKYLNLYYTSADPRKKLSNISMTAHME
jgi:hypothetical protein